MARIPDVDEPQAASASNGPTAAARTASMPPPSARTNGPSAAAKGGSGLTRPSSQAPSQSPAVRSLKRHHSSSLLEGRSAKLIREEHAKAHVHAAVHAPNVQHAAVRPYNLELKAGEKQPGMKPVPSAPAGLDKLAKQQQQIRMRQAQRTASSLGRRGSSSLGPGGMAVAAAAAAAAQAAADSAAAAAGPPTPGKGGGGGKLAVRRRWREPKLGKCFFPLDSTSESALLKYRQAYRAFRTGAAKGAKGEACTTIYRVQRHKNVWRLRASDFYRNIATAEGFSLTPPVPLADARRASIAVMPEGAPAAAERAAEPAAAAAPAAEPDAAAWMLGYKPASLFTQLFALGRELGNGHFSTVLHATLRADAPCDEGEYPEEVAVKKIAKPSDEQTQRLLAREVEICVQLSHSQAAPAFCKLIDRFEDDEHLFLVMELCDGGELYDRIIDVHGGQYPEPLARTLMRQLFEGVNQLHALGVIHRDLKVENVLFVDRSDECPPKISDFGLSRVVQNPSERVMYTGCGTVGYTAPEIIGRKPYGAKVDIFALGVIAYIVLSGTEPFTGDNDMETAQRTTAGEYYLDGEEWDTVSDAAKDLIRLCLAEEPDERPTATEALQHEWLLNA